MYRAPDVTIRCVACGGTNVTPPTMAAAGEHSVTVYLATEAAEKAEHFNADRARVCLECGHVMLTLSDENLRLFRMLAPALRPYP